MFNGNYHSNIYTANKESHALIFMFIHSLLVTLNKKNAMNVKIFLQPPDVRKMKYQCEIRRKKEIEMTVSVTYTICKKITHLHRNRILQAVTASLQHRMNTVVRSKIRRNLMTIEIEKISMICIFQMIMMKNINSVNG